MLGKSLTECEGKPHVWFKVAGDGNQDLISQAPSPDPTTGRLIEGPIVAGFGYVARLGLLGGWCHLAAADAPSVRRTWGENLRYGRRDGSR